MRRAVIGTGRFSRTLSALLLAGAMAAGLLALTGTNPAGAALAVTFLPATSFAVGDSPQGITSADFNGDNKPDLAAANSGSSNVSVLLGDGTGSFGPATSFDVGAGPRGIISADFNGDNKPDLATANHHDADPNNPNDTTTSDVSVLFGGGTGGFGTAATFSLAIDQTGSSKATGITSADFDGDGRKDLAVSTPGLNDVAVLRNITAVGGSTPNFGPATYFFAGTASSPLGITSADLDGDNKPDLATANVASNKVSVLRNTSPETPSFGAATPFAVADSPFGTTSADFNGDSKPDLATANIGSHDVSVLRNTTSSPGTPSFGTATNFAVGSSPRGITSVDLDGDGKLDLATANFSGGNVSVLLGDGMGSFGMATNFNVGAGPTSITGANFNGDAKPDLATANVFDNSVSVLLATNDLPTISNIADKTINQNTDTADIPFTIGDTETPAGDLTLSASSSNTPLVPNDNIDFGGSGANRTVKVTPVTNGADTANITVTVTDADGGNSSDAFELTVLDTTPPKVSTLIATRLNSSGMALRKTNFRADFSEAMNKSTLNKQNFKLFKCASATDTACTSQINAPSTTVTPSADGRSATLNPFGTTSKELLASTKYRVVVTTGAKDLSGNALARQKVAFFKTGSS